MGGLRPRSRFQLSVVCAQSSALFTQSSSSGLRSPNPNQPLLRLDTEAQVEHSRRTAFDTIEEVLLE